jgi:CPA2 family monovalent cation:H+ antiporter-2
MFLGAIVYCTSTGIVAKVISDLRRTANPETEIILGLSIFQDLVIAFLIVVLSGLAFGGLDPGSAGVAIAKSFGFCIAVIVASRSLAAPIQAFLKPRSEEIFVLLVIAATVSGAALAHLAGLSAAIGAFLTGLVFAETNVVGRIKVKVAPIKDLFVALLFFVFGLTINFSSVESVMPLLLFVIPAVLITKFATGIIIGRWRGQTERGQANIGTSLIAVGELSIVLAQVAVSAGFPQEIAVFTAIYVLVTALVGPIMMTLSHPISDQLKYTTGIGLAASDMIFKARMAFNRRPG